MKGNKEKIRVIEKEGSKKMEDNVSKLSDCIKSLIKDKAEFTNNEIDGFETTLNNIGNIENVNNRFIELNNTITRIKEDNSTNYQKEMILKKLLSKYLAEHTDDKNNLHLYYWIVQKWGGIGQFKQNENNNMKIIDLCANVRNNKDIFHLKFNAISSFSKIASFIDLKQYSIYDSRVIFALNWIKYRCNIENDHFFPFPESRSNILTEYDYRIFLTNKYEKHIPFYNKDDTYVEYSKLLFDLSEKLGYGNEIYKTEMLLFHISKNAIIKDIKVFLKSLNIN